jgi:DNA-binding IclR family transcriptional regulator
VTLLAGRGLVDQDPDKRSYRLTLKFASIGLRLLSGASFHSVIQPLLDRYARETGELVRLAVVVEYGRLAWIANAQGSQAQLRVDPLAGHTAVPHLTAAGKAWLSAMSEGEVVNIMAHESLSGKKSAGGPRALHNRSALQKNLAQCRELGYAVTVDEIEPGLTAVAAPIVIAGGGAPRAVAAISVAGPTVRIPATRIAQLGGLMKKAGRELSEVWELLGIQGPAVVVEAAGPAVFNDKPSA